MHVFLFVLIKASLLIYALSSVSSSYSPVTLCQKDTISQCQKQIRRIHTLSSFVNDNCEKKNKIVAV